MLIPSLIALVIGAVCLRQRVALNASQKRLELALQAANGFQNQAKFAEAFVEDCQKSLARLTSQNEILMLILEIQMRPETEITESVELAFRDPVNGQIGEDD